MLIGVSILMFIAALVFGGMMFYFIRKGDR